MFCRNCGAQNKDTSKFCLNCGTPLTAPAAEAAAEAAEAVQEAVPAVEAEVVAAADTVAETAAETVSEVQAEAEATVDAVKTEADAAVDTVEAGVNEAASQAADAVETEVKEAETVASDVQEQAEETVQDIQEEASAAPATGVAAVAAVAAELVAEANTQPAETVSQQPAQQQYATSQGQYTQQPQYQQAPAQGQPQQGYYSGNTQPEAPKQAQAKQPKPPKKKAGAGRVILTIFLSLFLIIFFTVCIVEYSALKTINKDNIAEALEEADLSRMVFDSDGEELNMVEMIEENAGIDLAKEFDISEDQLEDIMDTPTVKKFISDNLADMAESVLNGEEPDGISKKTILDYVKKNKKAIYKDLQKLGDDYENLKDITLEDIDNFEEEYGDQLDDAFDAIGSDTIDMDFVAEKTGMDFDISRYIKMIPILKWIAPGLAALFIILMLLGNIGYESLTGKGVGISAMIAGAITAGAAIAFKYIVDIPDTNVLKVLGLPMADLMMIVGGIAFAGGLLLLIITCIIKAIATRAGERRAA